MLKHDFTFVFLATFKTLEIFVTMRYKNAVESEAGFKQVPNSEDVKEFEAIKSNFSCAICLSITTEPCTPPCGHLFCSQCLLQWIKSNPDPACPKCRAPFSFESISHISNGYSAKPKKSSSSKRKILKPGILSQNMKFGNLIIYNEESQKPSLRYIALTTILCLFCMFVFQIILKGF